MGSSAYVDTGILLKLYASETNSAEADAIVAGFTGPLPLTHIQELEVRNALRLKHGRGELTEQEMVLALNDFQSDIDVGRYERPEYDLTAVFQRAEVLSDQHATQTKCRSLDVLHVAAAQEIGSREFASFDERQRTVARVAGFVVLPA
jgi:predicted nucleic acid-binding protein